jgi:hypothetical protein
MKRLFLLFILLLWVVLSTLCSCEYLQNTVTVTVKLPPFPEQLGEQRCLRFPSVSFMLKYPSTPCQTKTVKIQEKEITIEVPKMQSVPLAAFPVWQDYELKPAGALLTADSEADSISLNWTDGFIADILLSLMEQEINIERININRLKREIDEKITTDPDITDPWDLDRQKIINELISCNFRITDIKPLPKYDITFYSGKGEWFTESPFSPLYEADISGNLKLSLTEGYHILFGISNPSIYEVYVQENELIIIENK